MYNKMDAEIADDGTTERVSIERNYTVAATGRVWYEEQSSIYSLYHDVSNQRDARQNQSIIPWRSSVPCEYHDGSLCQACASYWRSYGEVCQDRHHGRS